MIGSHRKWLSSRASLPLAALLLLGGCESHDETPSRFRSSYHQGDYEVGLGYSQAVKVGKTI